MEIKLARKRLLTPMITRRRNAPAVSECVLAAVAGARTCLQLLQCSTDPDLPRTRIVHDPCSIQSVCHCPLLILLWAGCALSVLCRVTNWSVYISHGTKLSLWGDVNTLAYKRSLWINSIHQSLLIFFHQNIYLLTEIIDTMSLEKWKVGKVCVCCLFLET